MPRSTKKKRPEPVGRWHRPTFTEVKEGLLIWCAHGRCAVQEITDEEYHVTDEDGDSFVLIRGEVDPVRIIGNFDRIQALKKWESVVEGSGFVLCPRKLLRILTLEQWAFLSFLVDWMKRKIPSSLLEHNCGWFYCPANAVENLIKGMTPKVQQRLFSELKKERLISTKMHYGTKKVGGVMQRNNHRMIRIHFNTIARKVGEIAPLEGGVSSETGDI